MSKTVRKLDQLMGKEAFLYLQLERLDLMKLKAGTVFHADVTAADASPAAADLPTTIVMANNLKSEINTHMASAVSATTGIGVHLAADATNPISTAAATDLTTSIALLNAIKTGFNAHLSQAGVHCTNDGTNSVSTANATDLPTSITLANAMQTKVNAHFAASFTSLSWNLVNA